MGAKELCQRSLGRAVLSRNLSAARITACAGEMNQKSSDAHTPKSVQWVLASNNEPQRSASVYVPFIRISDPAVHRTKKAPSSAILS